MIGERPTLPAKQKPLFQQWRMVVKIRSGDFFAFGHGQLHSMEFESSNSGLESPVITEGDEAVRFWSWLFMSDVSPTSLIMADFWEE